ncbi:hypothetical protein K491DRAFT_732556 [Lophiostoma macrostomum CBS 122681]|uniref:Uncharacterized protein n=1 Tax=Lophiostoma macrostomum CBS 122681 TaxID=1314788 RepID=A0A6A6SQC4_9PLEO|nr:hypothetical protein K491DRAFT_732556 [Lophiostoma macrostomum CBS 122681]
MLLQSTLSLALLLFSTATTAAPVDAIAMGSKHNLYLMTCKPSRDCLLIICGPDKSPYTAVGYFANGVSSGQSKRPTSTTVISNPATSWDGATKSGTIGANAFTSTIDAGASALAKGAIAGNATMGTEEFACFRDGQAKISVGGDLGDDDSSCTADYWCASTQV